MIKEVLLFSRAAYVFYSFQANLMITKATELSDPQTVQKLGQCSMLAAHPVCLEHLAELGSWQSICKM